MAELKADVLILGAGMVGVGAALHLQRRGRDVVLIDRHELAGEETSYGNAGIVEAASVFPYMFPRELAEILHYASNRAPQVRYSLSDLPSFLPWLLRYYLASRPDRAFRGAMSVLPLIRRSLDEHEALIAEAGVPAALLAERPAGLIGSSNPVIDWTANPGVVIGPLAQQEERRSSWLDDFLNELAKNDKERNPNGRLRVSILRRL